MPTLYRADNIFRVLFGRLDQLFVEPKPGIWVLRAEIQFLFWDCMRATIISAGPREIEHFYESTVNHIHYSVDGHACFGDIGGDDDFSLTFLCGLEDC